jgi:hypothetical protein
LTQVIELTKDDLILEWHRNNIFEKSKSLPLSKHQLEDPTEEQSEWIENRMKAPQWTWQTWMK